MTTSRTLAVALAALALGATACQDATTPSATASARVAGAPGTHRIYGTPVKVGNGRARAYVELDQKLGGAPLEIGVALDETAMEGLPAAAHGGGHMDMHEYLLPLPAQNPTPFTLVELDWNPAGHTAPIYGEPHFDFHFYTISLAERNAIDPTAPEAVQQAANFPAVDLVLPGYLPGSALAGAPPHAVSEPRMGLHWIDPTSPELPPTMERFTRTYIMGTWDGRVIFHEPMVTRQFILDTEDETIPVPVAARYEPAGYWPSAYRVMHDRQAKEYRISLTQLAKR